MVNISIDYQGELRCEAWHGPSGRRLETDAPVDNHGKGESFSPTDLAATALGSCMATIMGIAAGQRGLDLSGMRMEVTKEMSADSPRRITRITTSFQIPGEFSEDDRKMLERAALECPVHQSLHPGIERPVTFNWNAS